MDRRRIELIEPGLPPAPIHHEGGSFDLHRHGPPLDDEALRLLVAEARASVVRCAGSALEQLSAITTEPVESLSVRAWPADFPTDIATLRRAPHESRADSVMYCQALAWAAAARGWSVHHYDAARVEAAASRLLGERADTVLHGPRVRLGPPWTKDHRIALAATVLAAHES